MKLLNVNFPILFRLYYKDVEHDCEYLLSISYNIYILYNFRNKYLNECEIVNSSLSPLPLALLFILIISLYCKILV